MILSWKLFNLMFIFQCMSNWTVQLWQYHIWYCGFLLILRISATNLLLQGHFVSMSSFRTVRMQGKCSTSTTKKSLSSLRISLKKFYGIHFKEFGKIKRLLLTRSTRKNVIISKKLSFFFMTMQSKREFSIQQFIWVKLLLTGFYIQ